jgi:hypothetical protein
LVIVKGYIQRVKLTRALRYETLTVERAA